MQPVIELDHDFTMHLRLPITGVRNILFLHPLFLLLENIY
jgi:hypothetical protein